MWVEAPDVDFPLWYLSIYESTAWYARSSPVARYYRADDPEWHWLENRESADVSDFLTAANQQHADWFAPLSPLADTLYHSHLARRELAVKSLETALDHFTFWSETGAEDDYPCWWRYPNGQPEQKSCFFDVRERAAEQPFYDMGDMALSPDEQWLAWTEDTQGDERFTLWLKALPNGTPRQLLSDIGPSVCWAEDQTADGATLLFTRFDDTSALTAYGGYGSRSQNMPLCRHRPWCYARQTQNFG